ncbi:MAG: ATP-binding protein [Pseudomonadales bacterium]
MPVWSLKRRMLLLNVGFLSIAVILLGFFFVSAQQVVLERFLLERGVSASTQLALLTGAVAEESISEDTLQRLADAVLEEHAVRSVTIYSELLKRPVHSGPSMLPILRERPAINNDVVIGESEGSYRFVRPIDPKQLFTEQPDAALGWVELEYANHPLIISMFQVLLTSGGVTLGLLISLIALALYFSNSYNRKVEKILAGISQTSSTSMAATIEVDSTQDELDLIASKLNEMWAQFYDAQKESERSAAQTTRDLRETLETLEVQNIELDLARKEAVNASHVKSEFLANTSHEIRTPLNGIIGFTNLIMKTPLADKQIDYVSTIRQSANGLLRIINDILDFSKIEAGKLVLDYITINLFDLLEETMTLMAPMSNDKDIVLSIIYQPNVPEFITGDPQRLQQVMTNLVHNAIKFTDAGYVKIEVASSNNEEIELSVSDTGIGMSDEQQRNLFSAFSQGDRSVSRNYGGTGLGLVIAQRLVEQMGSSIVLHSQEGEGSTFRFTLHTKIVSQQNKPIELQPLHVLYNHNDTGLATAMQHIFRRWNVDAERVLSFEACTEQLSNYSIDDPVVAVIGVNEANLSSPSEVQLLQTMAEKNNVLVLCAREMQNRVQSKLNFSAENILVIPLRRFELYDALNARLPQEQEQQKKLLNVTQKTRASSASQRILIVDDNSANLKLLRLMLEQENFDCLPVSSGAEAIALADQESFEMIFMDIQMPEISGIEAAQLIRTESILNKATPVIAVTAHAHIEDRNSFLRAGMNDYLGKPIMEDQLRSVLNRWSQDDGGAGAALIDEQTVLVEDTYPGEESERVGPVDVSDCLKLASNKPAIAHEMLSGLLESLAEQHIEIQRLAQQNTLSELRDAVHYLHGHACYTGVPALRQICHNIETKLKSNETSAAFSLLAELDSEVARLLNWHEEHDLEVLFEI